MEILYRNDDYSNSGVQKLVDIIFYEVFELGNTDILEYCNDHYQLTDDLTDMIDRNIELIQEGDDPSDSEIKYIAKELVKEICEETDKHLRYGLWLASKKSVIDFYDGTEENINAYPISDVILSDLGDDGKLFAYEYFPYSVEG